MKKLVNSKTIAVGFGLAFLLFCGAGIASFLTIQKIINNKQLIEHTYQTLGIIDKAIDGIQNVEKGQQGYIITQDKIYLETYDSGIQNTQLALKILRQLTIEDLVQQDYLNTVELLIAEEVILSKQLISSLELNNLDTESQIALTAHSIKLQEQIQAILNKINAQEVAMLKKHSAATNKAIIDNIKIVGLGYSLSFSIILICYFLLQKENRDRKRAEDALRQSEECWQLSLKGSNDAIWDWNLLTNEVFFSPRWKEMRGFAEDEISNSVDEWSKRIHPKDLEAVMQGVNDHFAQKTSFFSAEYRVQHKDGSYIWILDRGQAIWDEAGKVVRMAGAETDITARKQAEADLHESESRYRRIVETAFEGVWIIDTDNKTSFVNSRMAAMLGYQVEEMLGQPLFAFMDEEGRALAATYVERRQQGIEETHDFKFCRRDGSPLWAIVSAQPILDPAGEYAGSLGMVTDISDRKLVEQALRESEECFRNAFNYAAIGMALVSLEGYWLKVNPALCAMLGYSEAEFLGKTFQDITHPEDLAIDLNYARQLLAGEINFYYLEKRYFHKLGQVIWILLSGSVVRDDEGQPLYFIAQIKNISERKQMEANLRASETRLAGILDVAGDAIISVNAAQQILLFNQGAEKIFGFKAQEVLGQPLDLLLPSRFAANHHQHIVEFAQSSDLSRKMVRRGDIFGRRRDGTEFPAEASISQLELAGEKVFTVFLRDISDRKQAEAERAKLIAILEATPDFISSSTVDGQVIYFNKAARNILGISPDQELTNFNFSLAYPNWADQIIQQEGIPTAIRDGIWIGETALLSYEGREIPLSQLIVAHRRRDGSVKMLSTIARDISQQKQIADKLLESDRRWRCLLENVRLIVVGLDLNGKIEYVNPFFLELFEYSKDEVIGKDWFETFLPLHQKQRVQKDFRDIIEQPSHFYYQNSIVTKSGEEKSIAWNNTLLKDSQGNSIGTLSIGEDITERQAIERMKDEFLSVVSHELRTPLTSIHAALDLLLTGLVDIASARGKRVIEIAAENSDRLVRLVNDILELERLESGKISLSKQSCNTADLVKQATELMQVMANRSGITLYVSSESIQLNADSDRIIQVLTNLIGNAIKFSAPGTTISLTVILGNEENGQSSITSDQASTILFAVKDRGRGIPADKLETIFERFHQVDASDSRQKGGTGLGLAICRSIVQQHGGKIWANSILGEGSNFYFTLPID